jgi:hypothetical protein
MKAPRRRRALQWLAGAGLLGLAGAPAVRAHHGFGGRYDTQRAIYVAGEVVRARVGMPHPVLALRVAADLALPAGAAELGPDAEEFRSRLVVREPDRGQTLEIEFPPVARFLDLGPELRAGDHVAVIVLRNCNAPHPLRGQWIRLASGRVVVRQGRMQTEVAGC